MAAGGARPRTPVWLAPPGVSRRRGRGSGAALADRLVAAGWEVTLVDRFEPGDPRSESGGETRLLRYSHGADAFYTASAWRARSAWLGARGARGGRRGLVRPREGGWESDSERVLREQGIPVERLDPAAAARLYPEPRHSTTSPSPCSSRPPACCGRATACGRWWRGRARRAATERGEARPTATGALVDGRRLEADHVIWACGGLAGGALPRARPAAGHPPGGGAVRRRARVGGRAGWIDFDASAYGHALIEPYGMKVASDREGEPVGAGPAPPRRPTPASPRRATTSPPASRRWRTRPCAPRRPATTR